MVIPWPMGATRPRILGWRSIVVALVVGVVLAVASVPVGAGVSQRVVGSKPSNGRAYFFESGHLVFVRWYDYPAANFWGSMSGPHDEAEPLPRWSMLGRATRAESDPRPGVVTTPLDGALQSAGHYLAGWPWRSAYSVERRESGRVAPRRVGQWDVAAFGHDWYVPLLPNWPGLLANLLFYAAMVLGPLVLWRWWRLRRRVKRGCCVACGYELGAGVGVCPECGLGA